jgi:prepilin-type processing-associated H-X9-DG protein
VRRAAARSQCANNLKQIALGLHNYADTNFIDYRATLPAGTVPNAALAPDRRLSWAVALLPYVGQENLYKQVRLGEAWDAPANLPATQTALRIMHCPDWGREAEPSPAYLTAYLGVTGVGPDGATLPPHDRRAGAFGYDRRLALPEDFADGTSNTLLVLESARDNGPWARGGPATLRGLGPAERPYLGAGRPFGGTHFAENSVFGRGKPLGCNAAMADGSVRFLLESVSPETLEALATVAGGDQPGSDW